MLQAMRDGYSVTIMNGPILCGTTAVPQRYKCLIDAPEVEDDIRSERMPGKRYHRYYIPGAINTATKDTTKPIVVSGHLRNAGGRCEHTLDMFGEA